MSFTNVYEDNLRAESYAKLEFPGTYYLAYRDIPDIIREHISGNKAIDFGCGTGRSTRFLKNLGFDVTGVDISKDMIKNSWIIDPSGSYFLIEDGNLGMFKDNSYDLILSIFTFDNIPSDENKIIILKEMRKKINKEGKIISLVSSPEVYMNEWASFTTKEFIENRKAKIGDKVKIIMKDVDDSRPVEDILCDDKNYRRLYEEAGLEVEKIYTPFGYADEPFGWISETKISPWIIYVLKTKK